MQRILYGPPEEVNRELGNLSLTLGYRVVPGTTVISSIRVESHTTVGTQERLVERLSVVVERD